MPSIYRKEWIKFGDVGCMSHSIDKVSSQKNDVKKFFQRF